MMKASRIEVPHRACRNRCLRNTLLLLVCCGGLPLLGQFPDAPRPEQPPLEVRRAQVLEAHDVNKNGRLDQEEREVARKAWAAQQLARRPDRGFFGPPPELVAEFDTSKDGELDEEEARVIPQVLGERMEKMRKEYDRNGNNALDPEEIAEATRDIDSGKLKGIPRMLLQFAGRGPGGPRRGGPPGFGGPPGSGGGAASVMEAADRDGDGRLSESELETARSELARRRAAREGGTDRNGAPESDTRP
jgi:hypothetical protein